MTEEIQAEFIHDAEELIESLFSDVAALRAARLPGRERRELAARIFRHVHTLKGSAASHGAKTVRQIAHEFEEVLDGLRLGRVTIDNALLDAFESATDAIAAGLRAYARGQRELEYIGAIDQLRAIATEGGKDLATFASEHQALPDEITRALSKYDEHHLREAVEEGARLFVVSATFPIEVFDEKFRLLSYLLNEIGEIICTVPGTEPATAGQINFRFLYAAEAFTNEVAAQSSELGQVEFSEVRSTAPGARSDAVTPSPYAVSPPVSASPDSVVRIGLHQLDQLISDAGDLFHDANRALESLLTTTNRDAIETAASKLRQRFVNLEERLVKLRLVPLAQILERAAMRGGRIAARELGKEVEFEIACGDLGIDQALADAIADPLLHLVRNAVSHGIESPEERLAAGKRIPGRVGIAAFSEGSRIHVCVTDDGRGISPARVAAAATECGIAGVGAGVTIEECVRLIFRPGFSTAETVSDVSGRGIGLDVVDRAMAQAGGEIRVTTEPGAGATFDMILPATLALLRCVVARSENQFYCVESARVTDHGSLDTRQIERSEDSNAADTIAWKGEEVPHVQLRALLGDSNGRRPETGGVIIVRTSNRQLASSQPAYKIALVVDSIEGEQETLVRSLGRHATHWRGVSGATELLNGSVGLMLDLEQLLEGTREK
jgi:two-component system chemotaxis sensor kinase CheA